MPAKTPQHILDSIVNAYLEGATAAQASQQYGKDKVVCLQELKRRGIEARASGAKKKWIISPTLEAEIVSMLRRGNSQREVSEWFELPQSQVNRVAQTHGIYKDAVTQKEADKMIYLYLEGASFVEAAAAIGRKEDTCKYHLKARGICSRPRRGIKSLLPQMRADYLGGANIKQLARKYGFSPKAITYSLAASGVEIRRGKLTVAQEVAIVQIYQAGSSMQEAAAAFGCSWHLVHSILERHGVPRRKTEGKEWGIKISARCQGIPVEQWTNYAVSPWEHFKGQPEYVEWRNSVFRRDTYICQECRKKRGGDLQAHHIYRKALYPHMALVPENGITLCEACHEALKGKEEENAERMLKLAGSCVHPLVFFEVSPFSQVK